MWRCCFGVALVALPLASDSSGAARLYNLTVETSLPHLEENLRYAVTRSQQCLTREDLASAFPVLQSPSLAGCKLREPTSTEASIAYVLHCENSSGTTGTATWRIGDRHIRGVLEVKLGGKYRQLKNMEGTLMNNRRSPDFSAIGAANRD